MEAPSRPARALTAALTLATLATAAGAEEISERNRRNLETFDEVWRLVDETHFDATINGVDWQAVRDELRPRAAAAADDAALRAVLDETIGRLGQSHFSIISGNSWGEASTEGHGELPPGCSMASHEALVSLLEKGPLGDAHPGFELVHLDGQAVVRRVQKDSPAGRRRIKPGWALLSVGERSLADELPCFEQFDEGGLRQQVRQTWLASLVAGPSDSLVDLRFETGSGRQKMLTLERQAPPGQVASFGNLPAQRIRFETSRQPIAAGPAEVAVVRFNLWFLPVARAFDQAMDEIRAADGVVFDLRGNPGGLAAIAQGLAGHFFAEPTTLGALLSRRNELQLAVQPRRVTHDGRLVDPYSGPVAILIDGGSASTSELFAAGLRDNGRARLFGEASAGAALPAVTDRLPNGDVFLHATMDYRRPAGERVEGHPIRPDEEVHTTRADLLEGRDPPLVAATAWISDQLEEKSE
jgi:carboxyl-terminal processing protease